MHRYNGTCYAVLGVNNYVYYFCIGDSAFALAVEVGVIAQHVIENLYLQVL